MVQLSDQIRRARLPHGHTHEVRYEREYRSDWEREGRPHHYHRHHHHHHRPHSKYEDERVVEREVIYDSAGRGYFR